MPIYTAKPAPKQLRTIVGGSHCGFMDSGGLFCDSGAVDRATQLRLTRRLLTDWLLLYLDGDASRDAAVWGTPARTDPLIPFQGER